MSPEIDTLNKFLVGGNSQGIRIMKPPIGPMNKADCLLLAAYLVALAPIADDEDMNIDDAFAKVLEAVRNT